MQASTGGVTRSTGAPCLVTLVVLLCWYVLYIFAEERLGLADYDELDAAEEGGDDTGGVAYDDVFGIERYKCPTCRGMTVEKVEHDCLDLVDSNWTDTQPGAQLEAAEPPAAAARPTEKTPLVGGAAA